MQRLNERQLQVVLALGCISQQQQHVCVNEDAKNAEISKEYRQSLTQIILISF